jgi:hypothetical protein
MADPILPAPAADTGHSQVTAKVDELDWQAGRLNTIDQVCEVVASYGMPPLRCGDRIRSLCLSAETNRLSARGV